jgi:hypothetical protein
MGVRNLTTTLGRLGSAVSSARATDWNTPPPSVVLRPQLAPHAGAVSLHATGRFVQEQKSGERFIETCRASPDTTQTRPQRFPRALGPFSVGLSYIGGREREHRRVRMEARKRDRVLALAACVLVVVIIFVMAG